MSSEDNLDLNDIFGPISSERRAALLKTALGHPVSRLDLMRALNSILFANTNMMIALTSLQSRDPEGIADALRRIGENLQELSKVGAALAQDAYEDLIKARRDD